jgi:hypothetical protein
MFAAVHRVALVLFAAAVALRAPGMRAGTATEDILPQPLPPDRYAKMADRSPFAPPSLAPVLAPVAPLPPGSRWSDDLAVTLLTQQGGVYFATIENKSKSERFLLQSDREDKDRHLALASVRWGDLIEQTSVTLRHDNDFATVHFDPGAATAAPISPGRASIAGSYPSAAGTPAPGHLQPPPNPPPGAPNMPNSMRRRSVIRATPGVVEPGAQASPVGGARHFAGGNESNE